jgi:hypothetical protein
MKSCMIYMQKPLTHCTDTFPALRDLSKKSSIILSSLSRKSLQSQVSYTIFITIRTTRSLPQNDTNPLGYGKFYFRLRKQNT